MRRALVVVDLQEGFDDPRWGRRDNPRAEDNVARLVAAWRQQGQPVVFVRHDSVVPDSPLAPDQPGNALKPTLDGTPDLLVTKSVNSAFHGHPDLEAWLRANEIDAIAVCGLTTNHCCETTARVGGNLGLDVWFVLDATATFDRTDLGGEVVTAELLRRVTAANLDGEFARVVDTDTAMGEIEDA